LHELTQINVFAWPTKDAPRSVYISSGIAPWPPLGSRKQNALPALLNAREHPVRFAPTTFNG
jgi:hypothetical protein